MRPKRYIYRLLIAAGLVGMLGLTLWDYYQVRQAAITRNQRWVNGVTELLSSEREALTHWIERFNIKTATFRDIANSRSDMAALMMLDLKRHDSQRWARKGLMDALEPLDPRLGVLQFDAISSQKTLTGPVIFANQKPYFTVARPLGKNRVLLVFLDASRVWDILKQESQVWKTKITIYDYQKRI